MVVKIKKIPFAKTSQANEEDQRLFSHILKKRKQNFMKPAGLTKMKRNISLCSKHLLVQEAVTTGDVNIPHRAGARVRPARQLLPQGRAELELEQKTVSVCSSFHIKLLRKFTSVSFTL